MNLRTNNLKTEVIYEMLLSIINNLSKEYDYLFLTKNDFIDIINKNKEEIINNISRELYIVSLLKFEIEYIKNEKFKDLEQGIRLLSNYIDLNFNNIKTYEQALNSINMIIKLLKKCNLFKNRELLNKLVSENDNVSNILQIITDNKENEIMEDKILKLVDIYLNIIEEEKTQDNLEFVNSNSLITLYIKDINQNELLTIEEEKELALKAKVGDKHAKEKLIEKNLKLVLKVAQNYLGRGLDYLDLVQEGNIGLITAVEKYDISKGYRFSTYAFYWIKNMILRAIKEKTRNIRIPDYLFKEISLYDKVTTELTEKLNRIPTPKEISKIMEIDEKKVTLLHNSVFDTLSLNAFVNDDGEEFDFVSSDESVEEMMVEKNKNEEIRNLLESNFLKEREKEVLKLRYGFIDGVNHSLEDIGQELNLTRERIRQIEKNALIKLRKQCDLESFAVYLDNPDETLKNMYEYRGEYINSMLYDKKDVKSDYDDFSLEELKSFAKSIKSNKCDKLNQVEVVSSYKNDLFLNFLKTLDYRRIVIISLKLGLIKNKRLSVSDIAKLLKTDEREITDIVKEILMDYESYRKDNFSNVLDCVLDKSKCLKRKK